MVSGSSQTPQQVVLDASVWVSHILTTDRNHLAADTWVTNHIRARGTFVVPILFRIEIAAALSRVTKNTQLTYREVAQLRLFSVRRIMRFVPLNYRLTQDAITLAVGFGLRAGDAIYAAIGQQLGIPLVTFDTELLELPTSIITTFSS